MLARGGFSCSRTTDQIREEYKRKSSPTAAFVLDCIEPSPEGQIIKKALYAAFCEYCRNNKLPILSVTTFFSKIPQSINCADARVTIGGKRETVLKGIKFNEAGAPVKGVKTFEDFNYENDSKIVEIKEGKPPDSPDTPSNRDGKAGKDADLAPLASILAKVNENGSVSYEDFAKLCRDANFIPHEALKANEEHLTIHDGMVCKA
jgi:phage/plasmid-associated DNA primase